MSWPYAASVKFQFQQFFQAFSSELLAPPVTAEGIRSTTESAFSRRIFWLSLVTSLESNRRKGVSTPLETRLDLRPDCVPNTFEALFAGQKLSSERFKVGLDAEFIVRYWVSEVETSRKGEIGLDSQGKLC